MSRNFWVKLYLVSILNAPLICSAATQNAGGTQTATVKNLAPYAAHQDQDLLWENARVEYETAKWANAAQKLEQYLRSGQHSSHYEEARRMLAVAYLQNLQPDRAIPILKELVLNQGWSRAGLDSRLDLAEAYLAQGKIVEAHLSVIDVMNREIKGKLEPAIKARALLLKADCLIVMNHADRAETLLNQWRSLTHQASSDVEAYLRLRIKIDQCQKLAEARSMDESKLLAEFEERGLCLSEAAVSVVKLAGRKTQESALKLFLESWKRLAAIPSHPPLPLHLLTDAQKPRYMAELTQRLNASLAHIKNTLLERLETSNAEVSNPESSDAHPNQKSVIKRMSKTITDAS